MALEAFAFFGQARRSWPSLPRAPLDRGAVERKRDGEVYNHGSENAFVELVKRFGQERYAFYYNETGTHQILASNVQMSK